MKRAILILLDELKGKLSGYAVLLQYRYMNLCVKAEPSSLLSFSVVDNEGSVFDIEKVAGVMQKNDYQFEIVPHNDEFLFPICKAIMQTHPEFKQKVIVAEEEDKVFLDDSEERHIICTMPDVDNDRRKLLIGAVSTLYDDCGMQLDKAKGEYTTRLLSKMVGQSPSDIDEAKDALEKLYDRHKSIVKKYKENKEKEIEDAYQRWLAGKEEKDQKQLEQNEAMGEKAAKTLNLEH